VPSADEPAHRRQLAERKIQMNTKLTKDQVVLMTEEELQDNRNQLTAALEGASKKQQNIINGSIGLIEVELSNRASEIQADKNGEGAVETIDLTDKSDNTVEPTPFIMTIPSTLAGAMSAITQVLATDEPDNIKLVRLVKIAENNVDYTDVPYELCSDAELMRRLKLVWSKKVAAKKAGKVDELADLEKQEEMLNSYRTVASTKRTGTVSSDNVDHSKMSQLDLQKLIRNYQSKKSTAKKQYEAALAEGDTKSAEEFKGVMEHWQERVEDASKYRTSGSNTRTAELTKQVNDTLAILRQLPQSDEIAAKIKELESLL
jgi:hypothetical protein